MSRSIVILTEDRYEKPKKKDWYIKNILEEDGLLLNSLKSLGFNVVRASWSSKTFNWESVDYAIFRTTWDYFERLGEFLEWVKFYSKKIKFINDVDLILWNLDKTYLQKFPKKDVVPSLFLKLNEKKSLESIFEKTNWEKIIIKPSISAAAWNTHLVSKKNLEKFELIFTKLKKEHTMIVQEFQSNVLNFGEISLMVFGGVFSHAVLKKAKKNDYRVQDDYGGSVSPYKPSKQEIDFAEKIIKMCPKKPLYARVDILFNHNKQPLLSELEIIEPELWFRFNKKSADFLAEKIFNFINRH